MDANLIRRVAFAVVAIPLLVLIVWLGGWPLAGLLAIAGILAVSELLELARAGGVSGFLRTAQYAVAVPPLLLAWALPNPQVRAVLLNWWPLAVAAAVLWMAGLAVFTRTPAQRPLEAIATSLFGVAYVAIPLLCLFYVRHANWPPRSWHGTAAVFFPLVVVWICDTAAMFGGRIFGGAKLAPAISPGKTRSGALAGVVGGMVAAGACAMLIFPRAGLAVGVLPAVILGAVLSVVGQIGDLAESLFKREAGVKDSSALIPGHGGVLDRLDSLFFVLPVIAIAYHLLGVI